MRLSKLDLLAYGKFTDKKLSFPKAGYDFHVIIGPNEAGKSTVRRAITELLFGMEVRSPLGFKHFQSDLRIAGVLETTTSSFPFMRTKQQKSLRSDSGEILPESYLGPVLAGLKQETFEELHCLDHARLLIGGQGIVDPKNSVSQILFQAASGLEDFTAIRESLGERAVALFARMGKNNHFAKASEKLSLAQKTLKDVQVRTKVWVEARDALQSAKEAFDAERERRRELDMLITKWERARRLAPSVDTLSRLLQEVQELGEVVAFAPGTNQLLATCIEQMNAAAARLKTREEDLVRAQAALEAIEPDEAVLKEAAAIVSLGALCSLHPNHARDLPVWYAEVDNWLVEIYQRSTDLGWGTTEDEVRERLPQNKFVQVINTLSKTRGELLAEERAAQESFNKCKSVVDDVKTRLSNTTNQPLDTHLVQALELALPFKASESRQKNLTDAADTAQTLARNALSALGRLELVEDKLRSLWLPSLERVNVYRTNRQEIVQAMKQAQALAEQGKTAVANLQLKRTQFERSHEVVTITKVSEARRVRDRHWLDIKVGNVPLTTGAQQLDNALLLADKLADLHTKSAADAAKVQALCDQIEQASADEAQHHATVEQRNRELNEFNARWVAEAANMGLVGMELDDLPDWLLKKQAALQAVDSAILKRKELEKEQEGAAHARDKLVSAMRGAALVVNDANGLAALCVQADECIKAINVSRTRLVDLQQQLQAAESDMRIATKTLAFKKQAVKEWESDWTKALSCANLSGVGEDAATVESALLDCDTIRSRLESINATRTQRIKTVEADLLRMKEAADGLRQLSPKLAQTPPEQVFAILSTRLDEAKRQAHRKGQAEAYRDDAKRQSDDALSELTEVKRKLDPILKIAGVADPLMAVAAVERWDAKNDKLAEIAQIRKKLDEDSDSLSFENVKKEMAIYPAAKSAGEVSRLKDELGASEAKLKTLMTTLVHAEQKFDTINGGNKAAVAEASRQEALAEMSEVSEEYLQLATAGSLLKWAVDRYRDRKQGPLLERASVVFKKLTAGSFQTLRVDFDQTPPALVAYRPQNPQQVKLAGLSDGSRDQLFLALRIAALELQSEQGSPVPFIADDLFINFDDKRSQAGLQALYELSTKTQVIFISHQEHLLPIIQQLLPNANVITLQTEEAVQ